MLVTWILLVQIIPNPTPELQKLDLNLSVVRKYPWAKRMARHCWIVRSLSLKRTWVYRCISSWLCVEGISSMWEYGMINLALTCGTTAWDRLRNSPLAHQCTSSIITIMIFPITEESSWNFRVSSINHIQKLVIVHRCLYFDSCQCKLPLG